MDLFLGWRQLRIFSIRLYFVIKFIKATDSNYKIHFKMHFHYFTVHIRFQMGMENTRERLCAYNMYNVT